MNIYAAMTIAVVVFMSGVTTLFMFDRSDILWGSETMEIYMNLKDAQLSEVSFPPQLVNSQITAGTRAPKLTGVTVFPTSSHEVYTAEYETPFDFEDFIRVRNLPAGSNITVRCNFTSGAGGSEPVSVSLVGKDYKSTEQQVSVGSPQNVTFHLSQAVRYDSKLVFERYSKASLEGMITITESMPHYVFDASVETIKCSFGGAEGCVISPPFIHVVHRCPAGSGDKCHLENVKFVFSYPFKILRWFAVLAMIISLMYIVMMGTVNFNFGKWNVRDKKIMI